MPNGWTTTTLGELADLVVGRTPPRKEDRYWTDDLKRPFCTIADMDGMDIVPQREGVTEAAESEGKAKRVPAGSLLMSFKLTIGRVGFAAVDLFPNEAIVWIKPREGVPVVDRYLALWLSHLDLTESAGRAVKGQTLNGPSLRAIPVELPPLVVQRRVVDVVDAVDTYAAAAGRAALAAASTCTALRTELFADAGVAATPLRDLCPPGGIQIGPFGSQLHASDYVDDGGIPTVMPKDMVEGSISLANIARVGEKDWARLKKHHLEAGDILLPRRGDLTKRALVEPGQAGWLCGTGTVRIRLRGSLEPKVVFEALSTAQASEWLLDHSVGATMPNLNTEIVGSLPVRLPDGDTGTAGANAVMRASVFANRATAVGRAAHTLRGALLDLLLSGEHEIPDSYDELVA